MFLHISFISYFVIFSSHFFIFLRLRKIPSFSLGPGNRKIPISSPLYRPWDLEKFVFLSLEVAESRMRRALQVSWSRVVSRIVLRRVFCLFCWFSVSKVVSKELSSNAKVNKKFRKIWSTRLNGFEYPWKKAQIWDKIMELFWRHSCVIEIILSLTFSIYWEAVLFSINSPRQSFF